jgi:hypothetical protein
MKAIRAALVAALLVGAVDLGATAASAHHHHHHCWHHHHHRVCRR